MTPQCCGEMGYEGLRVSFRRSEFPSLYMFSEKIMALLTPPFQKTGMLVFSVLNEILQGRAEKRCLSPQVFLSAMDEWHPENRQIE